MPVHDGTNGPADPLAPEDEPPPLLGSWRNLYITVLVWLALLIVVFYFFTQYFT
ncbi:MAG: hypothetical protein JWN34_6323 [Bryobacterales bacterium]|jgi:hypothetical protein|nr:hypothetical protein [Bryobacterales bacterium]